MTGRLRATAAVVATLAVVASAPPSTAGAAHRARLTLLFGSRVPASSTSLHVVMSLSDPAHPDGKAPQLVSAVVRLPSGTVVRTTALPQCSATDTELTLLGAAACPESSRVGSGTVLGDTGFGAPVDPIAGEDQVFNGPSQILEVVTGPGMPFAVAFDRLLLKGYTLTAHPPAPPGGPPDGRTHVRGIDFTIPARGAGRMAYITTPRTCPRSGVWTTTGRFTFADGVTDTVATATPCRSGR